MCSAILDDGRVFKSAINSAKFLFILIPAWQIYHSGVIIFD